jgi:uncharacterized alpha-E superfamily protein
MLSRVANSIYWMSRYLERAENTARFIDVNLHMLLDLPDAQPHQQWAPLVAITGDAESFKSRFGEATQGSVIQFLTFDRENANSMYSCLAAARENARSIREVISSEMWEQINRSFLMLREAEQTNRIHDQAAAFFSHFKKACHLFVGTTDSTMTHGEPWHFARMGRLLERADMTSRILDVKYFILLPRPDYVGSPYDNLQWSALLKSASALEMYRKRYGQVSPHNVAEFLILDREFPRAIHYCLTKAEESLHAITGSTRNNFGNPAEQQLGRLGSELDYTTMDEIFSTGLHEYLDGFQAKLNRVGQAIGQTFFGLTPVAG